MKDILKLSVLTMSGLFVAAVLYPFMHEAGHVLATLLCGGEVKEFSLYPLPNVLCDVSHVTDRGMIVIGLAGIFVPFLICTVLRTEKFFLWFAFFVLRGIVLLSFLISLAVTLLNSFGIGDSRDDMIKTLAYWQNGDFFLLLLLLLGAGLSMLLIIKEKPFKRICKNFGIC